MEHTEIVTAAELEEFAKTRLSEEVIPEYIYHLVQESVEELLSCRIPYGALIGQPGWDGIVQTPTGYRQFVPAGDSYWEIGTGDNPQTKATSDFTKRTKATPSADRGQRTYVVVTPHSSKWPEPAQAAWRKTRAKRGWKETKILDGVQIADWLRQYPGLGKALLKRMGLVDKVQALAIPSDYWENLEQPRNTGDPKLPPKLFLVGRDQAANQLQQLLDGKLHQLYLVEENPNDAKDFVAAYIASISSVTKPTHRRCLFISDAETWLSMINLRDRHILIADPNLDLERTGEQLQWAATKRGHAVVIPISSSASSASFVPLPNPSAVAIESVLVESKFSLSRARELAAAGALSLSSLKRHLRGLGELPPYTQWSTVRQLAQAMLFGRWSGANAADKQAMEDVLGKSYGEWIEILRPESLRSDTPLTQRDEQWKITSRGEAWAALGPQLFDDDLNKFRIVADRVLGESNPKFELPPSEHYTAGIKGKILIHSPGLRHGIAETLALLGSKPLALKSCSHDKASITALLVVRDLLGKADWIRWASLSSELPLLAEAAPEEFLNQVETALRDPKAPFKSVFAQEGSALTGWNYQTGLLWALESLAWNPDFLVRVVSLLGELAVIDPGGTWANRPINSLVTILLPWFPQTSAPIPKRKAAIEILLSEQPEIGWKVLLALLPTAHGASSGTHKPAWQPYVPRDFKEGASRRDYADQIILYADIATRLAAGNLGRLSSLIDCLPHLPDQAFDTILSNLNSTAVRELPESERVKLWEGLTDLVAKHRRFQKMAWAMPSSVVDRMAAVADALAPKSPMILHRRIFSDRDSALYAEGDDFEAQQKALDQLRTDVVTDLYRKEGIRTVLTFAEQTASPGKVGEALGRSADETLSAALLPHLLEPSGEVERSVVRGFVWRKYWTSGWNWVDGLGLSTWTDPQKIAFLTMVPFLRETSIRAEKLLGNQVGEFWRSASVHLTQDKEFLPVAAAKLLEIGRPQAAIHCLYWCTLHHLPFPPETGVRALLDAVTNDKEKLALDRHDVVKVIEALQADPTTDREALFNVEWAYLSLLDHDFGGVPRTLEQRLAAQPEFFADLIRHIFRPESEKEGKERDEKQKRIAENAYRLLFAWRTVPGTQANGTFDAAAFTSWISQARRLANESDHFKVSMSQIGQVLPYAPADPDGLWIHRSVATALNAKDAESMRAGFTMEKFNQRGVHGDSGGRDELKIAENYKVQSEALETAGFQRFATAIRDLAEQYKRDAARAVNEGRFDE